MCCLGGFWQIWTSAPTTQDVRVYYKLTCPLLLCYSMQDFRCLSQLYPSQDIVLTKILPLQRSFAFLLGTELLIELHALVVK